MLTTSNWLDVLLQEEGITQADLARASSLDSGTISNIRNGKRRMGVDVAERIARATHRKTQDILRLAGEIEWKSPHKIRHGHGVYGVKHAKTMADYRALSQNMMHESTNTTDKYTAFLEDEVGGIISTFKDE